MTGKTISQYKILEKLGSGGMGDVYKAEDTKLQRTVALKFLSPQLMRDENARERLMNEARAAAALNHPNICTIYEIDEVDDQSFIVMEYIEGQSLQDKIKSKNIKIDEVMNIVFQISLGLNEAHEKGIVHRDIKSANIFLTDKGQVKIMDFGLAKFTGSSIITKIGITMGTIAYMSPEQTEGKEVNQQTDIWSFGVVFYEMLTGQLPFKGDYDQAVIYSILNEEPVQITELSPDVPIELEKICLKMLRKNPNERYPKITKFFHAIERVENKIPGNISHLTGINIKSGWHKWRVSPTLWLTIIILFGLTVGVLLFYPSKTTSFSERDWFLISDFKNLSGEDILKDTITEALFIDLQQSQYVNVFSRQRISETLTMMEKNNVSEINETIGREICLREGIKAMLVGSITKLDKTYILNSQIINPSTGDLVRTERIEAQGKDNILNAVDKLSSKIRRNLGESLSAIRERDEPLEKATTSSLQALKYFTIGKKNMALAKWHEAIPFYRKAIEEDSTFAVAYSALGVIYHNMSNYSDALKYSALAMKWIDKVSDRERFYIEAEYYRYRSQFKKAIDNYKILLSLYPDHFAGYNNMGFIYQYLRQYRDANEQLKQAIRISPKSWYVFQSLGLNYGGLGEFDKAIDNFNKALEINKNQYWSNIGLAMIYLMKNEIDKSKAQINIVFNGGDRWQSISEAWMALLCRFEGKYEEALVHLKKAIKIDHRINNYASETTKRFIVSDIYFAKNKTEFGLQEIKKAVEILPSQNNLMKSGIAYAINKMFDQAEKNLKKLEASISKQETNVNQAQLFRLQGEIKFYKENYKEAVNLLERSKILVDDFETRASLAKAYQKTGEYKNAIQKFEYIIHHKWATIFDGFVPLWARSHLYLAQLYKLENDTSNAIIYYEKYLAMCSDADKDLLEPVIARKNLNRLKNQ